MVATRPFGLPPPGTIERMLVITSCVLSDSPDRSWMQQREVKFDLLAAFTYVERFTCVGRPKMALTDNI